MPHVEQSSAPFVWRRLVLGSFKNSRLVARGVAIGLAVAAGTSSAAEPVSFNRDVQPILAQTCYKCHGPATQKAGLRLDVRDEAMKKAESGAVPLVPGKAAESEIIRRVLSTDADEVMPPASSNKTLTPTQKELLQRWVTEGATYEKHWSFETPKTPQVPASDAGARVVNPIDSFVAARLKREGLALSAEADKPTLIRRAAFALTGLPPTIKEVDEFVADQSQQAYEKMLDRYLASERFGEEMARYWLDVARYGDTHGLHLDNERQMWAYRDWVIKAFNQNKPFDQFTREQLAGDLLPNPSNEQLVATGFNRCNVTTGEGGSINEEWVYRNAVDRTTTMGEVWLGLTVGCCVCHEHKFDPLSMKDYYSMYAFFHSAADPPLDGNALLTAPTVKLTLPEHEKRSAELGALIADKQKQLDENAATVKYVDPASVEPRPAAETIESVWFDDAFPAGGRAFASPGSPTQYVTAKDGQVLSGEKALKRTDRGLAQDVYENGPAQEIPAEGKLFAHVWVDPKDAPKTLMLQYFKGGWLHRAVWGDYEAIDWGRKGTTERVRIGDLPETGKWVRLECEANKLGLNAGDQITGFAVTQFGGTVYWDKIGVAGRSDPAGDPRRSLLAWWQQHKGRDTPNAPQDLKAVIKAGPDSKKKPSPEIEKKLRDFYVQHVCIDTKPHLEGLANELAALTKQREDLDKSIPGSFIFKDLDKPRESFVMLRGQYNKPGDKVEPGVPVVLPPLKKASAEGRANRLDLANWLMSAEHPLTSRVTVNRYWQQFFGTGLVKSSNDFGTQGQLPSHPELLDWLAVNYRETGWNTKAFVKQLLMSATFRQSSGANAELWRRDPENRLYARGPRFRLDAEQVRDNALFVGGLINLQTGGRGVNTYQPPNIWEPVGFVGSNTANYKQDSGAALYRRSIYVFIKRTAPPPFMINFDAPNREQACSRRDRSNTPLQALQLLNDVQHFEAARALAQRTLTEGGTSARDRIAFAFRSVLSRAPDADELGLLEATLAKHAAKYQQNAEAAKAAIKFGESVPNAALPEAELAAYTLIANLILNLDETVTRN